jgi:hypothetical protein
MTNKFYSKILCSASLATALGSVLLTAAPSMAASFTAIQDSFVAGGSNANVNYDPPTSTGTTYDVIAIKNDTNLANNRKGYLQFNPTSVPTNVAEIEEVRLDLSYVRGGTAPFTGNVYLYAIPDNAGLENWNEGTVTWNNAPLNDTGSNAGFNSSAVLLATKNLNTTLTSGQTLSFSSNDFPQIANFMATNTTDSKVTFMLSRDNPGNANTNALVFASRENLSFAGPTLFLLTRRVPEPSSMLGLLVVGGTVVLGKKLKKAKVQES